MPLPTIKFTILFFFTFNLWYKTQPWVWATLEAYSDFPLSGLISPTDYPVVLMADSASVKLPNKEPDCSVNVLLPVGVTAPEQSRVASGGRNLHIRAIAVQPGVSLSQSASQAASWPVSFQSLMEEMDFTKAVCATWHLLSATWRSKLSWAKSLIRFDTKESLVRP